MRISAQDIMATTFHTLSPETPISEAVSLFKQAIRSMIFSDVHRLFVRGIDTDEIVGVFSLTDAARCRSGSCHACLSSRIHVAVDS